MSTAEPRTSHGFLSALQSLYISIFRPPNVKLRLKGAAAPNFYLMMAALGVTAYIIFSGIFFDIINNPPSMGQDRVFFFLFPHVL
jgi:hypothetical protein